MVSLRSTLLPFVPLVLALCLGPVGAEEPKPSRRILVIYPESDSKPGIILFDQSLHSTIEKSATEKIEIYNEYLDASRFTDDAYQQQFANFLKQKYAQRKLDAIVAVLMPSLDFLLKHRKVICPGVPIVHAAIEQRELANMHADNDVIGVPMHFDFVPTLEMALRLHPTTQNIVVVSGASKYDLFWEQQIRQSFQAYEGKLRFIYLTGLSANELLQEARKLPHNSIIYYLHMFTDRHGNAYAPANVIEPLSQEAHAPIYGNVDTYLGRGIVGGRLMSFELEGKSAAQLALRILRGESPQTLAKPPVIENPFVVDWRQMNRWGVDARDLPAGAIIRFQEPSFWDVYKWHILGVISLCIVEALLIIGLLLQRASRRKAEERFRVSVESAPNGMIMIDRSGHIVMANAQMEKLFGYQRKELLGASAEILIPERFRKDHPAQRASFFASPSIRSGGAGRDLFGRRKDGSEFPVEIGLNPILTEAHPFVLAIIIDITQRKQAEQNLYDTNRELAGLTGKLIHAQETERWRIARELHDDLNQNLALLSVDLDFLGQQPPESSGQLAEKLNEFSSRVKQISSSIHDLSHQLHPAKLEQLGLVPSLKSLCKEMNHCHDLEIQFADEQVPQTTSNEIALCLYRIAQESLHNVIKHSQAKHARVEVRSEANELMMSISDDGIGFDPADGQHEKGLGILSMRERLRLVNGRLVIDSLPGHGTCIEVHLPVNGVERASEKAARRNPQPV